MKKIFTLVAVASMAWCANAQTESWSVVNADGTLKEVYQANPDPDKASVVEFSTTNVSGTHVSGPIAGYIDSETLTDERLLPKVDNSWDALQTKALCKSESDAVAPFYYVCGKGNPVNLDKIKFEQVESNSTASGMIYRAVWDDSYYNPDGSAGLPGNGTYVTVKAKVAGSMKVAVWINKGSREIYVVKASDAKALAFGSEVIASGYINGQNNNADNDTPEDSPLFGYPKYQEDIATKGTEGGDAYVVGAGNQAAWVYLTFNAVADETYYVFNKNTQVGFGGFEFTPAGDSAIENIIANEGVDADAPIYNVLGQRVTKEYKGILIQNGKKFINK